MKNNILLALAFSLALPVAAMAQLEVDFTPTPLTDCDPLTVTFVGQSTGNPTTWRWDVDSDGQIDGTTREFTYTYNTPGNYRVTLKVEDGQGSSGEAWKEPYVVLPAVVPNAGRDTTVCSGSELQIGFVPPDGTSENTVYTWEPSLFLSDPSAPNPLAFPEETTTYIVTVENVGGCVRRDTITITVNPLPTFPEINRSGNTLTSSVQGATYRWYRDDTPIPGANQQSYTPTVNGSYAVEVINASGCSNKSSTFNFVANPSGVDREFAMMGVRLSPNPFDESTTLEYNLPKNSHVSVKLYDLIGREIATLADEFQGAGPRSIRIDGTPLAPGTYVCRITAGEFVHTSSVVRIR